MNKRKILIVDDDPSLLESLDMYLSERGYEINCAINASEGLEKNDTFNPDVIILDIRLPDMDGLNVLKELKRRGKEMKTIMITAFHDMETTIRAIKLGACEYIPKPIDVEELERAIEKVLKSFKSSGKAKALTIAPFQSYERGEIVGKSKTMKDIFKAIGILSENSVAVLIEGETGTGKELIARAIHYHSPYNDRPFLPINCSAIVGSLLESELFGHEKGAFTGAISTKRGKFELAGDGTIFLDEVGEIPFEFQAKLLRFLQEKEFERVGSEKILQSNARVIAATNKDLWRITNEGRFREDLYYRLSVATIEVPPLRERKSDIPLLIEYLLKKINCDLQTNIKKVELKAVRRMMEYDWPGNVRELDNILTRAVIMSQGESILEEIIPPLLGKGEIAGKEEIKGAEGVSTFSLEEVEQKHIMKVLSHTHWHCGKACKVLGISRPTLRQKLRKYGITQPASTFRD